MTLVKIDFLDDSLWKSKKGTYVHGKAFYKNELCDATSIADILEGITSLNKFKGILKQFNGFYGILKK